MVMAFLPEFEAYATALRVKGDKTENDETMSSHLDFFLDYIRTEHASTLDTLSNLLAHDEITFDLLWALLVPRIVFLTLSPITGEWRAVRLLHAERGTLCSGIPCWDFEAEYVEYNEDYHMEHSAPDVPKFGLERSPTLSIPIFDGAAKISSLPHYPMKYHLQVDGIKARLIERGRKWCALQGVHHKYFKGAGVDQNSVKYNVRTSIPYNTTFTKL